jgi:CubicO group peptidase (beta-lactamase class C family)
VGERGVSADTGPPLSSQDRRLGRRLPPAVLGWVVAAVACQSPTCAGQTVVAPVADSGAAYVPGATWRTAAPAAVGLDAARVDHLVASVDDGRYGAIDALVVVRYGWLAVEHYHGWAPGRAHTLQSVTKSVTSLLYGILREQQPEAAALDRPVLDVLARYQPVANLDDRKRALTLRNLLTMRTGMDFWEQPYDGSPLQQLNGSSGDWMRFILDRPMVVQPGTRWAYNSGAAIAMCGVIREIAGEDPVAFARQELLDPLGVTGDTWFRSPFDGLPHCGGGLSLKPVDLARVGYLVLRRGRWGDRQVVPAAWVDSSTVAVSRGNEVYFSSYGSAYGAFWWLFPLRRGGTDASVVAASGSGGQWLFVIPELDLVVAVAASDGNGLDLLYDEVLPAVRSP